LLVPGYAAVDELHGRLLSQGVRTVLHNGRNGNKARISFVITARHTRQDVRRALVSLANALGSSSPVRRKKGDYGHEFEFRSRIV